MGERTTSLLSIAASLIRSACVNMSPTLWCCVSKIQLGAKTTTPKKKRSLRKSFRVGRIKMPIHEMYVHTCRRTCAHDQVSNSHRFYYWSYWFFFYVSIFHTPALKPFNIIIIHSFSALEYPFLSPHFHISPPDGCFFTNSARSRRIILDHTWRKNLNFPQKPPICN